MKKLFLLMTVCSILLMSCEKDGGLPSLPDPDDVCSAMDDLTFMKYCYDNFDVNGDKKVSLSEANAARKIDVKSKEIKSLKGIQYFTNLTFLNCSGNSLEVLDVSKNTELTEFFCHSNALTSLDVSNNKKLKYLDCRYNKLSAQALNSLFSSLPNVTKGLIFFSGNPGKETCDSNIYIKKGWLGFR